MTFKQNNDAKMGPGPIAEWEKQVNKTAFLDHLSLSKGELLKTKPVLWDFQQNKTSGNSGNLTEGETLTSSPSA